MIYLYVKTHSITGLKYFGKTTKNPLKYNGSGVYWKRHLKIHGSSHETEIIATFTDEEVCEAFALEFSKRNDVVGSSNWANLIQENGKDGAPIGHPGHVFTNDQKLKISKASKKNWEDPVYRERMMKSRKAVWTDELREAQSRRLSGVKRPDHAITMTGKKLRPDHPFHKSEKTDSHRLAISRSLKGMKKSAETIEKLKQPKRRVCRLEDRRDMSIGHFTRWCKKNPLSKESGFSPEANTPG